MHKRRDRRFLRRQQADILRKCKVEKFRDIIEQGRAKGRVSVRRSLFKLSNTGNVAASIFLAKNLLGYKDYFSNEHSGPGGAPIVIEARPDFSKLSNEELELLRRLVGKTKPADRN